MVGTTVGPKFLGVLDSVSTHLERDVTVVGAPIISYA